MESNTQQVVKTVRLTDNTSPRRAWYDLSILKLLDGYIVKKCSGGFGAKQNVEMWFRYSEREAEKKFYAILKKKTNPHRVSKRHYKNDDSEIQPKQIELF